ncbi:MAG: fumarylacetoacetate hydrolase family protein [Salinibacterium sp.]|nr:fumarylacetoacetate hydrolase family protein [Salinibacterium sp.]
MKLLQFETTGIAGRMSHVGVLVDGTVDTGTVIDVTAAMRCLLASEHASRRGVERLSRMLAPSSTLDIIEGGPRLLDAVREAVQHADDSGDESDPFGATVRFDAGSLALLPAISNPPMLRDFMAFEKHLKNIYPRLGREIPDEWYRRPVYYKANTASIGAHRQDIHFPSYADQLDLEFEFAAILGRDGTDIPEEDARDWIFGYTIYNDLSARAIQGLEMSVGLGPAKGKDFHGAHVLGPVIVTADELPDPYVLAMNATVNGEQWTAGGTADMHWRFEQMIAYASRDEPLRAGEVFGSGTVGDGSGAEQDRWLDPGDVVELDVPGIGTLRNRVVNP